VSCVKNKPICHAGRKYDEYHGSFPPPKVYSAGSRNPSMYKKHIVDAAFKRNNYRDSKTGNIKGY
jgi:hypothetical protein